MFTATVTEPINKFTEVNKSKGKVHAKCSAKYVAGWKLVHTHVLSLLLCDVVHVAIVSRR